MKAARRSPATEVVCWDEVPLPSFPCPRLLPALPLCFPASPPTGLGYPSDPPAACQHPRSPEGRQGVSPSQQQTSISLRTGWSSIPGKSTRMAYVL